jgi:hypothetical protein
LISTKNGLFAGNVVLNICLEIMDIIEPYIESGKLGYLGSMGEVED